MKTCKRCGNTKAVSNFHKDSREQDGYYHICKVCRALRRMTASDSSDSSDSSDTSDNSVTADSSTALPSRISKDALLDIGIDYDIPRIYRPDTDGDTEALRIIEYLSDNFITVGGEVHYLTKKGYWEDITAAKSAGRLPTRSLIRRSRGKALKGLSAYLHTREDLDILIRAKIRKGFRRYVVEEPVSAKSANEAIAFLKEDGAEGYFTDIPVQSLSLNRTRYFDTDTEKVMDITSGEYLDKQQMRERYQGVMNGWGNAHKIDIAYAKEVVNQDTGELIEEESLIYAYDYLYWYRDALSFLARHLIQPSRQHVLLIMPADITDKEASSGTGKSFLWDRLNEIMQGVAIDPASHSIGTGRFTEDIRELVTHRVKVFDEAEGDKPITGKYLSTLTPCYLERNRQG